MGNDMKPLVCLLAVLAFTGCGGGTELTAGERVMVAEAQYNFANLVLNGSGYGASLDSVDKLVAICREKPDATYDGLTMRQVLNDAASDLAEYRPAMARSLDRAAGE